MKLHFVNFDQVAKTHSEQIVLHERTQWCDVGSAMNNDWRNLSAKYLSAASEERHILLAGLTADWQGNDAVVICQPLTATATTAALELASYGHQLGLKVAVLLDFSANEGVKRLCSAADATIQAMPADLPTSAGNAGVSESFYGGIWMQNYFQDRRQNNVTLDYLGDAADVATDLHTHAETIVRHEAAPVGSLGQQLRGGFGLMRAEDSPSLLAVHLAANQPVMIAAEAPQAEYVRKNEIGIVFSQADEIMSLQESISPEDYESLVLNAERIAPLVRSGMYARRAITKLVVSLNDRE